jgi:hypothetical protein
VVRSALTATQLHYALAERLSKESTMEDLETRLTNLENGVRRWKRISLAIACGMIGLVVMAAGPAGTADLVRCQRLEIVNPTGTVVARIEPLAKSLGGDGGWITCFSSDGKPKIRMGAQVGGDGQLDVMSGPDNVDSDVTLSASPEGGGQITLNGPNQAPYVKIAAAPGKSGQMSITNKTGATIWHAP